MITLTPAWKQKTQIFVLQIFFIPDSNIEKYVYEMRSSKLWRNFLYVTQMQLDFEGNIKLHFRKRRKKAM